MLLNRKPVLQLNATDKTALLSSVLFMCLTHAYRWMNSMYSHDSLMVLQADGGYQIALGRFLNPVYVWIRGYLAAPFLIAVLSTLFMAFAVMLMVRILGLRTRIAVILTAGLTTAFESIAFLNAAYIQWLDIQLLSVLLAAAAAWFMTVSTARFRFPAAVLCCTASLGLYQSSIETALMLVCLYYLRKVLTGAPGKKMVQDRLSPSASDEGKGIKSDGKRDGKEGGKEGEKESRRLLAAYGSFVLAGLLYYIFVRTVCAVTGNDPVDNYNGLVQVTRISLSSLPALIGKAWFYPFHYLLHSEIAHRKISAWLYIAAGVLALSGILHLGRERKLSGKRWILTQGMKHGLMTFSFSLYAAGALMILELCCRNTCRKAAAGAGTEAASGVEPEAASDVEPEAASDVEPEALAGKIWFRAAAVLCGILIFNHIVFAYLFYTRKDLEIQAGRAFMNRLTERMEETPGYEVGRTKVAILGNIDENPVSHTMIGFQIVDDQYVGTRHHLGPSYYDTYSVYFEYMLEYPIRLSSKEELISWTYDPEVQSMPVFPAEGSVRMIGDTLVIRLSESLQKEGISY